MGQVELVLVLLVAVAGLATLARRLGVPYPILLVLGGVALGFVPGLPRVRMPPDVAFLLFIPPLVYVAAVFTPLRDLRRNLRPIGMLAVGLVLVSAVAVAALARLTIDPFDWPTAFVLATIVAPTDLVAVTAITSYLRVPRRVITILEGEGLLNDVTALVAYRLAVGAVVSGSFSLSEAGLWLLVASLGGVAAGLVVGWLVVAVRRWLDDSAIEITVSLLTPYAAYLLGEALNVSGILATVTTGLYVGRRGLDRFRAETRVQGGAFWQMLVFLLNGLAFILIGLELRGIVEDLQEYPFGELLGYAALVSVAVIVVRIAWVFAAAYVPALVSRRLRQREAPPRWRPVLVVAWAGMRGTDSLATALALPLLTASGAPFPHRHLIIFLAFGVILATLVLQGLSLPPLIRWLGLKEDEAGDEEEAQARLAAAEAALQRLDELERQPWAPSDAVSHLRQHYGMQGRRFCVDCEPDEDAKEGRGAALARLRRELLNAARRAVINLRNRDTIGDDILRRVERDIDLEELRFAER